MSFFEGTVDKPKKLFNIIENLHVSIISVNVYLHKDLENYLKAYYSLLCTMEILT